MERRFQPRTEMLFLLFAEKWTIEFGIRWDHSNGIECAVMFCLSTSSENISKCQTSIDLEKSLFMQNREKFQVQSFSIIGDDCIVQAEA